MAAVTARFRIVIILRVRSRRCVITHASRRRHGSVAIVTIIAVAVVSIIVAVSFVVARGIRWRTSPAAIIGVSLSRM